MKNINVTKIPILMKKKKKKCDKSPLQNKEDRNQLLVQTENQKEKHTTFL